jgi:hypothetical protein
MEGEKGGGAKHRDGGRGWMCAETHDIWRGRVLATGMEREGRHGVGCLDGGRLVEGGRGHIDLMAGAMRLENIRN